MTEIKTPSHRVRESELTLTPMRSTPPNSSAAQIFLADFQTIELRELGRATLLERQETKYLFRSDKIAALLRGLESWYRILEIDGQRIFRYQSTYYDTPGLRFYHQHHRGATPRWKFRKRTYLDSGQSYLESKHKDNHRQTSKVRQQVTRFPGNLSPINFQFAHKYLPVHLSQLQVTLHTNYSRITLVAKSRPERVTLDFNLSFQARGTSQQLLSLLIIEVKQLSLTPQSPFIKRLRKFGLRPTSFSKYCVGSALLNPNLKQNRFRPILRKLEAIHKGALIHERSH